VSTALLSAGRAGADAAPAPLPRAVTLILPGPITFDGTTYRAFRPYARLANALLAHFERVVVCTQVIPPGARGFGTNNDALLDPRVAVDGLPAPFGQGGVLRSLGYQAARVRAMLRMMGEWDVIYAFIPSYPGAVAYTVNRFGRRRPIAVYIANDWEEITPFTFRWEGLRRRLLFRPYRWLLTRWERWIMRTAPLAVTAGRALLAKYGGTDRPVYETAPLVEMGPADMHRRADTCQAGPVRLLFVGTLVARKGLPVLLEAMERLAAAGRDVALDVVGDGPDRAALEAEARRRGLEARARFHGFVAPGPDLFAFYRRADLFVLPTYSEGFPRVLYEALGHSLPTVASAVSGIPHLLEDGRHALLVPPGDPAALAAAVGRALDDGALRRRLIREGFELVGPIIARDPAEQFVELFRRHLAREGAVR
jgi:glycosyltransferase involved in cell wall biosynthesis